MVEGIYKFFNMLMLRHSESDVGKVQRISGERLE